jgi:hypothetical protein
MDTKLARYITTLISQDIDKNLPKDAMCLSSGECVALEKAFIKEEYEKIVAYLDKKFEILRNEIKKPYPKIRMDKRRAAAIDNLKQLLAVYPVEKDYLNDLIEVIQTYDDLSDGELKYLEALTVRKNNAQEVFEDLKQTIPVHYIIQIKTKAEKIDSQTEIIMFTEDLRSDKH